MLLLVAAHNNCFSNGHPWVGDEGLLGSCLHHACSQSEGCKHPWQHVKDRLLIINAGKGKRKNGEQRRRAVRTSVIAQRRKAPSFFHSSASWPRQTMITGLMRTSQSLHVARLTAPKRKKLANGEAWVRRGSEATLPSKWGVASGCFFCNGQPGETPVDGAETRGSERAEKGDQGGLIDLLRDAHANHVSAFPTLLYPSSSNPGTQLGKHSIQYDVTGNSPGIFTIQRP